jgi:dienelactone hydrolase
VRRALALAAVLLAGAVPAAAQVGGEASFVVRMGIDTFAVESFARTPGAVEGQVSGRAFGRVTYRAELGPDAATTALAVRAWPAGAPADSAAPQAIHVALRGDSAIAEITTSAGTRTQRLASREGAVALANPSFGLTEQIVMRAWAIGGERVEVPVFMLQGGQTATAVVTRIGADSVVIAIAAVEVRAAVGGDGRLLGGAIPSQNIAFTRVEGLVPYAAGTEPPDYSAPEGAPYTAEEVVVSTPAGHTLAGTFTRPAGAGRVPAVVTVTGSGPQDRDEASPAIPGWRPFREMADTLARRGIAVLRLDDRGTGASGGDFASATSADFADDVRAALAYLRTRPDVDARRLAVVGHSEGGLIGPMVAAEDPALRALVVVAGPARTGREIIHYQQRFAIESFPALSAASRDSMVAAARAELEEAAARQPWLRFFLDHDPIPTARRVRTPVLVLQCETDRQVTPDQAVLLAAAFREGGNADVTVHIFHDVNHLLLPDPDGSPAGYASLRDRRVAREVLGTLADWLAERLR